MLQLEFDESIPSSGPILEYTILFKWNTLCLFSNILKTVDSNLTGEMLCLTKPLQC